jgi:hypothetical protein
MKKIILMLFAVMMLNGVIAHQPRVGFEGALESPIQVEKPEISKAYYGELEGNPEYYEINSDNDFLLYLNILAPDIQGARKDFIVEVLQNDEIIFILDDAAWGEFYEPFGGDNYLMGPELEEQVTSGTYIIKVSNPDNAGKYSLAVGKIESFPPIEIIKTIFALPKLKKDFFNKSPLTAYFNYSGLFLLILLILILALIFGIRYLIKKYKKKK